MYHMSIPFQLIFSFYLQSNVAISTFLSPLLFPILLSLSFSHVPHFPRHLSDSFLFLSLFIYPHQFYHQGESVCPIAIHNLTPNSAMFSHPSRLSGHSHHSVPYSATFQVLISLPLVLWYPIPSFYNH